MRRAAGSAPRLARDAEVIERSWADPAQFAVLFDRHAPLIYRYVARRVGLAVADDLVADTFLAAFEKRQRYDPGCPDARPWLYGIATNLIGQHRRAEARQYRIMQAIGPEPDLPGHDDRVAADETARGLRGPLAAALAGLPAADRDVLLLIAWEQLSYTETAQALGIPVGTVRSRLNRARSRIRVVLAAACSPASVQEVLRNE
jgi:RNA polymerase sigma-70 factor (ECF subfamily)